MNPSRLATFVLSVSLAACSEETADPQTVERSDDEASDWLPKKLEDGPPYFRWRLQEPGEGLKFIVGTVDESLRPLGARPHEAKEDRLDEEVHSVRLQSGGLLLSVGPVGHWSDNETLYLILESSEKDWRIREAGLWHTDDYGGSEWVRVYGTVTIESRPDGSFAIGIDLWALRLKQGFRRSFSHSAAESASTLLENLKNFEGIPAVRR